MPNLDKEPKTEISQKTLHIVGKQFTTLLEEHDEIVKECRRMNARELKSIGTIFALFALLILLALAEFVLPYFSNSAEPDKIADVNKVHEVEISTGDAKAANGDTYIAYLSPENVSSMSDDSALLDTGLWILKRSQEYALTITVFNSTGGGSQPSLSLQTPCALEKNQPRAMTLYLKNSGGEQAKIGSLALISLKSLAIADVEVENLGWISTEELGYLPRELQELGKKSSQTWKYHVTFKTDYPEYYLEWRMGYPLWSFFLACVVITAVILFAVRLLDKNTEVDYPENPWEKFFNQHIGADASEEEHVLKSFLDQYGEEIESLEEEDGDKDVES